MLFTTWAWPSHYFPLVPLALALREAGHEVRVASPPALRDVIDASGLPAVEVGADVDIPSMARAGAEQGQPWQRGPYPFDQYLAVAEAMVDDVIAVARAWRPDLLVHEPTAYAGPLAAGVVGIPTVRHLWGPDFTLAARKVEPAVLAPLCRRIGLNEVETLGALTVDPCPPSLQIPGGYVRRRMRFVPYNGAGTAPRWLRTPAARPRVCATWGTTLARLAGYPHLVAAALAALDGMDVELVAAVTPHDREFLGGLPSRVRVVESLPLHLLLPTCSVLIHPGGPGTMLTAIAAGVPQFVLPCLPEQPFYAHRLVANGAGLALPPAKFSAEGARLRVGELLGRPAYREAADRLRREMADQPTQGEVVAALAELAVKGA